MKFQIGDKIRFRYTGDRATILKDNLDGSYMVTLEADDDEIVAFADDIILADKYKSTEQSSYMKQHEKKPKGLSTEEMFYSANEIDHRRKAEWLGSLGKTVPPPAPKTTAAPQQPSSNFAKPTIKPTAATDTGLYLTFVQDSEEHYTIYLVNDTPNSVGFVFELYLQNYLEQELKHTITPHSYFPVGELAHHQLNDSPIVDFACAALKFQTSIKIKYKSFVKTLQNTPLIGIAAYTYKLIDINYNPLQQSVDLAAYTKQHVDIKQIKEAAKKNAPLTAVEQKAAFPQDIDLHIEKLVPNPKDIDPRDVLDIQLKAMEDYLYKAAKLSVEQVYIIHGIGDGKLKEAVDKRLKVHPLVKAHYNKYYPEYGFGATEVVLK